MATKIITVASSPPSESSGSDYNKGAPLNATEFDQNLINLRAAIDRRSLSAAPTFTGVVTLSDATESSSTSTGCLVLAGGLGLAKKLTGVNAAFNDAVSTGALTATSERINGGVSAGIASWKTATDAHIMFSGSTNIAQMQVVNDANNAYKALEIYASKVTIVGSVKATTLEESGSWTPVLVGAAGSAGSYAATATGTYRKIGNMVSVTAYISMTNKGSWTGAVSLQGLPFTPSDYSTSSVVYLSNVTGVTRVVSLGSLNGSTTMTAYVDTDSGATQLNYSVFNNNSQFGPFELTYYV